MLVYQSVGFHGSRVGLSSVNWAPGRATTQKVFVWFTQNDYFLVNRSIIVELKNMSIFFSIKNGSIRFFGVSKNLFVQFQGWLEKGSVIKQLEFTRFIWGDTVGRNPAPPGMYKTL